MADDFDNVTEECFTSTKSFWNFPCAHRQYKHDGNCHLIHGYSRSFHFVFGAVRGPGPLMGHYLSNYYWIPKYFTGHRKLIYGQGSC